MYHRNMTIKRRLFFSNIRMTILSFAAFGFIGRIITFIFLEPPDPEMLEFFRESINPTTFGLMWFLIIAVFFILITIINNVLTYRMTKRIVKPLEPLSEGVRQIRDNNLAYRIDYQNDDEFKPVCDAFNEMAAKLETSTAQREKDEANRRELIAGISHDLRTPLTSIKVSIAGIKSGVAATLEQQNKYFAIIENQTSNMEHIIDQLFLFSKLDMEEFRAERRLINCGTMLEDCIEELSCEYQHRGLAITSGVLQEDCFINIDPLLFRRVIINIVENSVKYKTSETGHLSISCVKDENVTITIADNGPGVARENLEKLFDVFYRTDQSRNEKGSGLGLPISSKIIAKMGGTVHAELPDSGGLAIVIKFPQAKNLSPLVEKEGVNA